MFPRLFILPHVLVGIGTFLMVPTRCYVYHFGAHVRATIHSIEHRRSKKGGDYYEVGFDYTLGGRRYVEEHEGLSLVEGAHARVGDRIEGRAVAVWGRALFLRESLDIWRDVLSLGVWSLFWNAIVSVFVWTLWIVPIRQRLLARNGQAAAGVITGRQETRGRGTSYTLFYTFRTSDGTQVRTKSGVPPAGFHAAHEGAPVTAIYDPRKPHRSLPYEFSEFVVADAWGRSPAPIRQS